MTTTPVPENWTIESSDGDSAARETRAAPVAKGSRIEDMDIVRGIALFGVLTMNLAMAFRIPFFGNPWEMPKALLERIVFRLELIFVAGRAMTLFSILFGVGLAIFLERASARGPGAMWLLARRLLFLTAFGLVHAFLIWNGDILVSYSLAGLIALPFIRRRTWVVFAAAGVFFLWHVFGHYWPWIRELTDRKVPGHFEEALRVYGTSSYWDIVRFRANEVTSMEMPGYVFLVPDELAKMLLGVAIWKSGVLRLEVRDKHQRALRWTAILGILYGTAFYIYRWIHFELYHPPRTPPSTFMQIALHWNAMNIACALGYGAVLLLLLRHTAWRRRLGIFAPLGRMAFTNYLTQSIVFTTVFYGYGFGLLGKFGLAFTALVGIAFYILQGIVSTVWLRHFRFGPFEWAWRSLTYGQLQPLRRAAVEV
ncbi:DUF418 domain-containing protein [Pendulispora rubella]|uniref:DUF418 domain-containing protein n=1 Tax=Pendulispora rubella TaxID=2741070 RepID=A0ABZ2LKA8_9BACT